MNRELEELIPAYEAVSASRDEEARQRMDEFESLLEPVLDRQPGLSQEHIKAHRKQG